MAAENALWNQGSDSATKEKWFWDNSTCDRDTLQRSKYTQVSDGQSVGGPTGTLMRLYSSSAVPVKARIETGCAANTTVQGDGVNADALQDV